MGSSTYTIVSGIQTELYQMHWQQKNICIHMYLKTDENAGGEETEQKTRK